MARPAGQDAKTTLVPPAATAGDDPFGLAPWLKQMPAVPLHPLMAHPAAALTAATAVGLAVSGQIAGMMLGAMQAATGRARAALDEAQVAHAAAAAPMPAERALRKPEAGPPRKTAPKTAARDSRPAADRPKKAAPARKAARAKTAKADDLKRISGVGPKLEQVLNGMGVTRYAEIAAWSAADVARIEAEFGLDGRIARDGWVEQAKGLAKG